ncbi:hypothetical protein ACP70R_034768 [Stipagrostis hirtigluma subsp. patula]
MASPELGKALALRKGLVSVARMAEKVDRTSDMFETVIMVAEVHEELDTEEIRVLSRAFQRMFYEKSDALWTTSKTVQEDGSGNQATYLVLYSGVLEDDMETTLRYALSIIQSHLLPFSRLPQNVVLYIKMVGDINWHLAKLKKLEDTKKQLIQDAWTAYESADKEALENLSPAHPIRLAVSFTKACFYHDVKNWPERACTLVEEALEKVAAGSELASLDQESYKESTEIIGWMEEKHGSWISEANRSACLFHGEGSSSTFAEFYPKTFAEEEEHKISFKTPYSARPPSPVLKRPVPAGPPDNFISPGDWGSQVDEHLSENQIRSRKKAAQAMKGRLG